MMRYTRVANALSLPYWRQLTIQERQRKETISIPRQCCWLGNKTLVID